MAETVNIRNEITGAVGTIPAKLFHSDAFNKGQWTLYDGPMGADCGCNGQSVPEQVEDEVYEPLELETPDEEEDA